MRSLRAILLTITVFAAGASPALAHIDVSPLSPTAADPVEVFVFGTCSACVIHFEAPQPAGEKRFLIKGETNYIVDPPILHPYLERFALGPLPAGTYRVDVEIDGKLQEWIDIQVAEADPFLRFHDARLSVKVNWKNPWGPGEGTGNPVVLTPESGYFHFFDWKNVELTVKLLDGRPVNGRWWLFVASMTTLELEIEVTQCPPENLGVPCLTRTYVQPGGQNRSFVDTTTFSF